MSTHYSRWDVSLPPSLSLSVDTMPKSVESVFIFQERSEGELNVATPTYDAIVVEQWTIIHVSADVSHRWLVLRLFTLEKT